MESLSAQMIVNLKKIKAVKPLSIPKIPAYFVDTDSLQPLKGSKPEGISMIDKVSVGTVIGNGSIASNSASMVRFEVVDIDSLRLRLLRPTTTSTSLQLKGHEVLPINLPDLTDLALHPKEARIYYYWLVSNCDSECIWDCISQLMRETAPKLPIKMETYMLRSGVNSVAVKSFANYFKAVDVSTCTFEGVDLSWRTESTTSDIRDGRTSVITFTGRQHRAPNSGGGKEANHVNFLIWNCRGMAHTLFQTVLDYLVELHWPDFVLLLETRVVGVLCERIVRDFSFSVIRTTAQTLGGGGFALLGKGEWPKVSKVESKGGGYLGVTVMWS